jgi:hypothetical protein
LLLDRVLHRKHQQKAALVPVPVAVFNLPEQPNQSQLPMSDEPYAKQVPETNAGLESGSPGTLVERPSMRRTLLAVGIAVLVSMMLAPHGDRSSVEGWGPFFSSHGYTVNYSRTWIWYHDLGEKTMIDMLALQTVFLAVLFAVAVNLRKSWRRQPKPPPSSDNFAGRSKAPNNRLILPTVLAALLVIALLLLAILSARESDERSSPSSHQEQTRAASNQDQTFDPDAFIRAHAGEHLYYRVSEFNPKLPPSSMEFDPHHPPETDTPWQLPTSNNPLYDAQKEAEIKNNRRSNLVRVYVRGVFQGYTTLTPTDSTKR